MGGDWQWAGADMKLQHDILNRREIVSATFEEWITHVFDGQPALKHSRLNEEFVEWSVPASDTVDFLGSTFEDCGALFGQFNDHQIADGLWYIASEENIALTLWDESVLWAARKHAI